ncbi:MAG: MoxR family ATPase, partial [Planctomycetota bacterium]
RVSPRTSHGGDAAAEDVVPERAILDAREEIRALPIAEAVERYIVSLIYATREPQRYGDELASWVRVGASPRGTIALDRVARAHAWLRGGDHVTPDDVRAVAHDCLRHRVMLSFEANADGVGASDVVSRLLEAVAVA